MGEDGWQVLSCSENWDPSNLKTLFLGIIIDQSSDLIMIEFALFNISEDHIGGVSRANHNNLFPNSTSSIRSFMKPSKQSNPTKEKDGQDPVDDVDRSRIERFPNQIS